MPQNEIKSLELFHSEAPHVQGEFEIWKGSLHLSKYVFQDGFSQAFEILSGHCQTGKLSETFPVIPSSP